MTEKTKAVAVVATKAQPQHHWAGPSSFWRVLNCPGSKRLSDGLKEEETPEMVGGTELHDEVARRFLGERKRRRNEEDEERIARALAFLEEFIGDAPVRVEQRLYLQDPPRPWLTFGTVDYLTTEGRKRLVDLKFYGAEVEGEGHGYQAQIYAAMTEQAFPGPGPVEAAVYNPVLDIAYKRIYEATNVSDTVSMVKEAIRRAEQPDAPLNVGDWCKTCSAIGICPAVRSQTEALARSTARLPVDPQELRRWYDAAKLMEIAAPKILAMIRDQARSGGPIPEGVELRTRKGPLTVHDMDKAFEILKGVFGEHAYQWVTAMCDLRMKRVNEMLDEYRRQVNLPVPTAEELLSGVIQRSYETVYLQKKGKSK